MGTCVAFIAAVEAVALMPDQIERREIDNLIAGFEYEISIWAAWPQSVSQRETTRKALTLAADWRDGVSAAGTSPAVSGGGISRPTETAAGSRSTRESLLYERLSDALRLAARGLRDAQAAQAEIMHRPKDNDLGSAATCEACSGVVAQVGEDRIKAGYCPGCYQAWLRALKLKPDLDRVDFERSRMAKLTA